MHDLPIVNANRADFLTDRRGSTIPDGSWPPGREAPAGLEVLRRFLNTENPESGADLLATATELRKWFRTEGHERCRVTADEFVAVCELRKSLRAMAVANADAIADESAMRALTRLGATRPMRLSFGGSTALAVMQPSGSGVDAFIASMLGTVFVAMADGTWGRLKACGNSHCRWVVYDRTKNRSVAWCAEEACGSRSRARAYRARLVGR